VRKEFSYQQIELISFHDLSELIELNLACNKLDNAGFKILIEHTNLANLTNLNVANNYISELPSNIEPLTRLQYFNIGNFMGEERRTCNRLRESNFEKMLQHKWEHLKTLDV
jgi:Leucine-rich repeat (LRR) protein